MSQLNVDPQEIAKFEALLPNGGINILNSAHFIKSILYV
jgi:hypothetical protein